MDKLEARLTYTFQRPELLRQALIHRSFGAPHNERLEFVGDAALNCVIALALFQRFPKLSEGDLSRLRAHLVNRTTLYEQAVALGLADHLRLGEGEIKSGGAQRPSILADALEAVFGAVMLDGGFEAARRVIEGVFSQMLGVLNPEESGKDPKTQLQEMLQGKRMGLPEYQVIQVSGEAHRQFFEVSCGVAELQITTFGRGASRRSAEQEAAAAAFPMVEQMLAKRSS